MDSNIDSTELPAGLAPLAAAVDALTGQNLAGLPAAEAAQRVLELRGLLERLEGHWLRELATVDTRGAAGAEDGVAADSTAGWLRHRARLGATDAHQRLRLARALHRGPLAGTARALAAGELSVGMRRCWPAAPSTCHRRRWPTPSRCWWRPPAAWTRRGCAG
jgi:hypothetical protein